MTEYDDANVVKAVYLTVGILKGILTRYNDDDAVVIGFDDGAGMYDVAAHINFVTQTDEAPGLVFFVTDPTEESIPATEYLEEMHAD
jgi:hypothetical protein